MVIRAPNHLGELVLALPAIERAAELWTERPLVQVPAHLGPVLAMAGPEVEPLPMEGRHRLLSAAVDLRARSPEVGVLLTPSFSAALLLALGGVSRRRGTDSDARGWLLTDRVDRDPLLEGHRVREYLTLVEGAAGVEGPDDGPPRPRLRRLEEARRAWRSVAGSLELPAADGRAPTAGLVPGGRASSRRWPAERWRELARRLLDRGFRVLVFGDDRERALTRSVAGGRPGAVALGGRTDLLSLAGGLDACDVVAANDTGPMHLAGALDRPMAVIWGAGDPAQTRPLSPRSRLLGTLDLPCHPCLEQDCPRSGEGYRSGKAERECLRLVSVERAAEAILDRLEVSGPVRREGGGGEQEETAGDAGRSGSSTKPEALEERREEP